MESQLCFSAKEKTVSRNHRSEVYRKFQCLGFELPKARALRLKTASKQLTDLSIFFSNVLALVK
ncbi:uncharacterized protein ASCRUDRAFT_95461 [Ascoidea rubescens DSM 1968]|uniref:Uncharacterized protein n=1 Tax=Ascoidea rubescens DSM 1968 TaxID=1344418 RepID=A0A1D2VPG5_9ASCO|nr:hypothetical protein ASCRUDRAFT_95461 [Ascoidea rubescens DSM 1968]ODV63445.1 hypothetical protein ASCRUDRAFT_95461 [Ascoidea rubescens DSM 1968]